MDPQNNNNFVPPTSNIGNSFTPSPASPQTPPVYTPPPSFTPPTPSKPPVNEGGVGALIGSIIVILVLIFGAIYFWGKQVKDKQNDSADTTNLQSETPGDKTGTEEGLANENYDAIDADFNQSLDSEVQ